MFKFYFAAKIAANILSESLLKRIHRQATWPRQIGVQTPRPSWQLRGFVCALFRLPQFRQKFSPAPYVEGLASETTLFVIRHYFHFSDYY
jgi:hypothetical protein